MADKIIDLTAATEIEDTDLLYIGRDPFGVTDDRKITGADVKAQFLQPANNLSEITDVNAARTKLGLGSLALQNGVFSGVSSGTNTGNQDLFSTISVPGQDDVVAGTTAGVLTFNEGSGMTIITDAATDTITFSAAGGGGSATQYKEAVQAVADYSLVQNVIYDNGTAGVGATLTSSVNTNFTADGATVNVGDRFLVTDALSNNYNGIYVLNDAGGVSTPWVATRATDSDTPEKLGIGYQFTVLQGNTWAASIFYGTSNVSTIGTDPIRVAKFLTASNAGKPLTAGGNLADIQYYGSQAASRYNLVVPAMNIYGGDPNGHIPGELGDFCKDNGSADLYLCTTAGSGGSAVWTPVNYSGGGGGPFSAGTGTDSAKGGDVSSVASGNYSIAYGSDTTKATGPWSYCFGKNNINGSAYSLVVGSNNTVDLGYGLNFVFGNYNEAHNSDNFIVGQGLVANHVGCTMIGDSTGTVFSSSANDQFRGHFDGGFIINAAVPRATYHFGQPSSGTTSVYFCANTALNPAFMQSFSFNPYIDTDSNMKIQYTDASGNGHITNLSHITINVQTGTTYTLADIDNGANVVMTNNGPLTFTLPQQSNLALLPGTSVLIKNAGSGNLTFAIQGSDSLSGNGFINAGNSATVILRTVSPNVWDVYGGDPT